jgi:hypothetical protein
MIERLAREASPEMIEVLQNMARHSEDDRVRTMAATKLLEFLPKVKEDSAGEGSFAAKLEKMSPRELREWLIGQCEDISRIEVPEGFILSPEDSARHAVVLAALTMAVHGIAALDGRLVDLDALEEDGTRGYPRHRQQPPGPLAECPTAGPLNPRSDFIVVDPELVVPERSLYTTSRAPAECPPDGRSPGVSTAPAEDIPKTVVKDAAYWRERKRIQRARQKAEAAGGA